MEGRQRTRNMREAVKHEWDDFLGVRVRVSRRPRQRFYRTFDYRPTGWGSPGVKKIIRVYFRVTLFIVKMLISIPLAIVAIGAFWLFGVIIWVLWTARH
jgi:hypothetical protein